MSISDKIKALLSIRGKKMGELAEYFEMSPQGMRNKMSRQSFSTNDLVKVCEFAGAKLIIEVDENTRIVLDESDLKK